MLLTENNQPNDLEKNLSKIENNDVFVIKDKKGQVHEFIVITVNGAELLLTHKNSNRNFKMVVSNDTINGNKVRYYQLNGNQVPLQFEFDTFEVYDSSQTTVKFVVNYTNPTNNNTGGNNPNNSGGNSNNSGGGNKPMEPEPSDVFAKTQEGQKLLKDFRDDEVHILRELTQLKQFDDFIVHLNVYQFDPNNQTYEMIPGAEAEMVFAVDEIKAKEQTIVVYLQEILHNTTKALTQLVKVKYHIKTNDLFVKDYKKGFGVALKLFPEKGGNYIPVANINLVEKDESEEKVEKRGIEDYLKDKDLMKLINNKTAWDSLFGRKGKGIKPLEDLKKKDPLSKFVKDRKVKGSRVFFYWFGPTIKGKRVALMNNQEANGYMLDSNTIKISGGKNSYENILIKVKDINLGGKINAVATMRDENKNIGNPIDGKVKVIK